jgi:hypothetical protein
VTEAEWLACNDWRDMFDSIEGKVSSRKLRLFAVACCRVIWTLLDDESRRAAEVAERFADGLATGGDLRAARDRFQAIGAEQSVEIIRGVRYLPDVGGSTADEDALWAAKNAMRQSADKAAWSVLRSTGRNFTDKDFVRALDAEMNTRRDLLHDVLGPLPF